MFARGVLCFVLNTSKMLPLLFVLDRRRHTAAAAAPSQPRPDRLLLLQEREKLSLKRF